MSAERIVKNLLENDPIDPKDFSDKLPGIYDDAVEWAKDQFMKRYGNGDIRGPRHADEYVAELATDAQAQFDLLEDDDAWEAIVTPLFKLTAELYPDEPEE